MAPWLAYVFGSSGPGWSPVLGHRVVFLGKALCSHSAYLLSGVQMGTGGFNVVRVTLR